MNWAGQRSTEPLRLPRLRLFLREFFDLDERGKDAIVVVCVQALTKRNSVISVVVPNRTGGPQLPVPGLT